MNIKTSIKTIRKTIRRVIGIGCAAITIATIAAIASLAAAPMLAQADGLKRIERSVSYGHYGNNRSFDSACNRATGEARRAAQRQCGDSDPDQLGAIQYTYPACTDIKVEKKECSRHLALNGRPECYFHDVPHARATVFCGAPKVRQHRVVGTMHHHNRNAQQACNVARNRLVQRARRQCGGGTQMSDLRFLSTDCTNTKLKAPVRGSTATHRATIYAFCTQK